MYESIAYHKSVLWYPLNWWSVMINSWVMVELIYFLSIKLHFYPNMWRVHPYQSNSFESRCICNHRSEPSCIYHLPNLINWLHRFPSWLGPLGSVCVQHCPNRSTQQSLCLRQSHLTTICSSRVHRGQLNCLHKSPICSGFGLHFAGASSPSTHWGHMMYIFMNVFKNLTKYTKTHLYQYPHFLSKYCNYFGED